MSYEERLRYLKLHSLKGRRLRGDLIQAYKIFQDIDDIAPEKLLPITKYGSTRNQGQKLRHRHTRTDIRKYTFTNRIVDHWNSLPLDIKNSKTLNTFKNRIDSYPKLQDQFYHFDER